MTCKAKTVESFAPKSSSMLKSIFDREKYEQNERGENVLLDKLENGRYIQRVYFLEPYMPQAVSAFNKLGVSCLVDFVTPKEGCKYGIG